MRTEQIQEYLVLCQHNNLGIAADLLAMSQSSLSRHILQMEGELGFTVFDRTPSGVEINETGNMFYRYAVSLNNIYSDAVNAVQRLKRKENGAITISITQDAKSSYKSACNKILRAFSSKYPDVPLVLQDIGSMSKYQALHVEGVDFLFSLFNADDIASTDNATLIQDPIIIVMPSNHPLCPQSGKSIPLASLARERFILPEYDSVFMKVIEESTSVVGFMPQPVNPPLLMGSDIAAQVKKLNVPAFWIKSEALAHPFEGTSLFEVSPPNKLELIVSWLPGHLTENKSRFIEVCKKMSSERGGK